MSRNTSSCWKRAKRLKPFCYFSNTWYRDLLIKNVSTFSLSLSCAAMKLLLLTKPVVKNKLYHCLSWGSKRSGRGAIKMGEWPCWTRFRRLCPLLKCLSQIGLKFWWNKLYPFKCTIADFITCTFLIFRY